MKRKWDMLHYEGGYKAALGSTNPEELRRLADGIISRGPGYFPEIKEIKGTRRSPKGHRIELGVKWKGSWVLESHDWWYFVLSMIAEFGWQPYPDAGTPIAFIKYHE
jgi:hypothetical protein